MPLKGISKNVIEISDTGNECFERAILFLRPGRAREDAEELRARAGEFLSGLRLRRGLVRQPARNPLQALRFLTAAAAVVAVTAALVIR